MSDAEARSAKRTEEILRDANALLRDDHFVYITGQHGEGWIDKDAIFPDADFVAARSGGGQSPR